MATGIQMYNVIKEATADYPVGAEFLIHKVDANDLIKLRPSDLESLGYDLGVAEGVSSAVREQDFGPLGRTMGIRFVFNSDAPRLATH